MGVLLKALFYAATSMVLAVNAQVATGQTNTFVPTQYSVVSGIFIQDDPTANLDNYDLLNDSFGLIDKSPERWTNLTSHITNLNAEADDLTAYKLIYVARHGEGWHNVAEAKYGSDQWNCYWSELTTDGNITWGPDPSLTLLGEQQASSVNAAWKTQLLYSVPLPQSLYSSPLRRSADTLQITWSDILLSPAGNYSTQTPIIPIIKEGFRETIGLHTCDQRSSKTIIAAEHPTWQFEKTFSENDQLWNPTFEESAGQQALRTQGVLNDLFVNDPNEVVGITAHSGTINAFFTVTGHRSFGVQPGGFVPVLVKAVGHSNASQPVITGGQSATAPACSTTPAAAAIQTGQSQQVLAAPTGA